MTVLVGVLCDGGVVIGADSSATFGTVQAPTIEQPVDKLHIVENRMIVAMSGQLGHGQRFLDQIEKLYGKGNLKKSPLEIGKAISGAALTDFNATIPNLAQVVTNRQLPFCALVASVHNKKPYLIEFEPGTLQPELKDNNLWYVSMSSGAKIADPFLGIMRNSILAGGPPSLATGKFAVYWTLHHTCEVNPGGVKEPIRIAVLDAKSSEAKLLSEDELREHHGMIGETYKYLSEIPAKIVNKEDAPEIPG